MQNILVVAKDPKFSIKISDFSIAKSTLTQLTTVRTNVGTDGYRAPEIARLFRPKSEDSKYYDAKCDIWSCGCMLYELLVTTVPFTDLGELVDYCRGTEPFPEMDLLIINVSSQSI